MRMLAFDSVGGASGDMILAALIELGVDVRGVVEQLKQLGLGSFRIEVERAESAHITGTRVRVIDESPHHHHQATHAHHHAPHRGLSEIRSAIAGAPLPGPVKQQAIRVFERIGAAEAKIHGIPVERVHFHEIGALDSIVDIVGACLSMATLNVGGVAVGPLPMGRGVIECAHGTFPNPAPATMELLRGVAIVQTDEPHELVTPTAAALLSEWKTADLAPAGMKVIGVGHGIGHRALERRPNLLRAVLLEMDAATEPDSCLMLETNIDDSTPEILGALATRLLAEGALDVFTTPVQMKQQRPGVLLSVLCPEQDRERMLDLIFRESTTFGIREQTVRRHVLARRSVEVETPYGRVAIKMGSWRGAVVARSPEFRDCKRRAEERGVPVRTVYEAALSAAAALT